MEPGTVWVKGGTVGFAPAEEGRPGPVIEAPAGVTLKVNGSPVSGPYRLAPGDQLEVELPNHPGTLDLLVTVSSDGMQAWVEIRRRPGVRYELVDEAPTPHLKLRLRQAERPAPPPVTREGLLAALERAGVRFGIDDARLAEAVTRGMGRLMVAAGRPPVPPVDGKVELLFEERASVEWDPDAPAVDFLDRGRVNWVEPGTLLAVLHPPVAGQPGLTVTGRPVPPARPKEARLRVAEGVRLEEEGRKAVAAQAGRPTLIQGAVAVVPVYTLNGNADVSTGHIRFRGDVHIRGDVQDQVEVEAGGEVRVSGVVSFARVIATRTVRVRRHVISSTIEVGGRTVDLVRLRPQLEQIAGGASTLERAVSEVLAGLRQSGVDAGSVPFGEIVKRLLENRFRWLPQSVRLLARPREDSALAQSVQALKDLVPGALELLEALETSLLDLGPLRLQGIERLTELAGLASAVVAGLEQLIEAEADLEAGALQNSTVVAAGRVILTGQGAVQSNITAGTGIEVRRGVLRGGTAETARGLVRVKNLGSPTGAPTRVRIGGDGELQADVVHPNVELRIGGLTHIFRDPSHHVRVYVAEEALMVEGRKAG